MTPAELQLGDWLWWSLRLVPQLGTQLLQLCDELLQSSDTVLQLTVDLTCGHICVHLLEEEKIFLRCVIIKKHFTLEKAHRSMNVVSLSVRGWHISKDQNEPVSALCWTNYVTSRSKWPQTYNNVQLQSAKQSKVKLYWNVQTVQTIIPLKCLIILLHAANTQTCVVLFLIQECASSDQVSDCQQSVVPEASLKGVSWWVLFGCSRIHFDHMTPKQDISSPEHSPLLHSVSPLASVLLWKLEDICHRECWTVPWLWRPDSGG